MPSAPVNHQRLMPQDLALQALLDVTDALEITGNQYWLSDGTLLGAVRENDFIVHDYDIDIGVHASSFKPEFLKITLQKGFHLLYTFGRIADGLNLTLERSGIRVDIFLYYKRKQNICYSYYVQFTQSKARRFDCVYPFFKRVKYTFLEHEFWIPQNVEEHLETQYGPDWRIPVPTWNWVTDPHNKQPTGVVVNLSEDTEKVRAFLAEVL